MTPKPHEGRMSSSLPPFPEVFIGHYEQKWTHCEGLTEATLIRMSILREMVRELHAEKSQCLARGMRSEIQKYKGWEARLEELRSASSLEGPLRELLNSTTEVRKRTRLIPEAVYSFLTKEKLERYDRAWESALIAEAASLGWCFWALDAWVKISQAEEWHRMLGERLLPNGIVLFAEASPNSGMDGDPAPAPEASIWAGRWWIVLQARWKTPDFQLDRMPGTSLIPSAPRWKLMYSPPVR